MIRMSETTISKTRPSLTLWDNRISPLYQMNWRTTTVHSLQCEACIFNGPHSHCYTACKAIEHPFVHPVNPGPFNPPEKGTETEYNNPWCLERISSHVPPQPSCQEALISQLISSVGSPYLAELCNNHASRYGDNNLTVLLHLFTTYGHITPQQLKTPEMEICNMNFHMELPVETIFNSVDEIIELA